MEDAEETGRRLLDAALRLRDSLGEYVRQSMYFNPEWRDGLVALDVALELPLSKEWRIQRIETKRRERVDRMSDTPEQEKECEHTNVSPPVDKKGKEMPGPLRCTRCFALVSTPGNQKPSD